MRSKTEERRMQVAFRLPFLTIRHPHLSRNKCRNCRKKGKTEEFHQFITVKRLNSTQPHTQNIAHPSPSRHIQRNRRPTRQTRHHSPHTEPSVYQRRMAPVNAHLLPFDAGMIASLSSTNRLHLKSTLDPRNIRHHAILQHHLHNIEPEWHLVVQKEQPVARPLPNQPPLRRIHRPGRRPVIRPRARLHLHEQQNIPFSAHQIHLPAAAQPEIRPQHLHPTAPQPRSRQQLPETPDPCRRPPVPLPVT